MVLWFCGWNKDLNLRGDVTILCFSHILTLSLCLDSFSFVSSFFTVAISDLQMQIHICICKVLTVNIRELSKRSFLIHPLRFYFVSCPLCEGSPSVGTATDNTKLSANNFLLAVCSCDVTCTPPIWRTFESFIFAFHELWASTYSTTNVQQSFH